MSSGSTVISSLKRSPGSASKMTHSHGCWLPSSLRVPFLTTWKLVSSRISNPRETNLDRSCSCYVFYSPVLELTCRLYHIHFVRRNSLSLAIVKAGKDSCRGEQQWIYRHILKPKNLTLGRLPDVAQSTYPISFLWILRLSPGNYAKLLSSNLVGYSEAYIPYTLTVFLVCGSHHLLLLLSTCG